MPGIVVLSNRGPATWQRDPDGSLVARRGGGGLVSGLAPLLPGRDAHWIATAMSAEDREMAGRGAVEVDHINVRMVEIDEATYRSAYDVVANATLWFVHHRLFDLTRRPLFGAAWSEAWSGYRRYNEAFARVAAEVAPESATVLVQDYHLCLVPPMLVELRPDVSCVHFSHTPFGGPDDLRVLPTGPGRELLAGMAAARACGFHTQRWADAFSECCAQALGRRPTTFAAALGPDVTSLAAAASSDAASAASELLDRHVGDRQLIVRVDRMEPSKNILRGLLAFDSLLSAHPEHRRRVVFSACAYASRETLPEYLAYRAEAETLAERINRAWSEPGWLPLRLEVVDDYPRSLAALRRYDVLLVNPVRDGLNLVAKEGPVLNERDGVLVLSGEAGAWEDLGPAALGVNPFDVGETAEQLHRALAMDAGERAERAARLRELARARTPEDWLDDQLAAARS